MNLIGINMHPQDLDYVDDLARHYCTEERVFMTLKKLEDRRMNNCRISHPISRLIPSCLRIGSDTHQPPRSTWHGSDLCHADHGQSEP